MQLHRSKRETFDDNSEIIEQNEYEQGIEDKGSSIGCPSAKYFVHPRVAYSVRGKITVLSFASECFKTKFFETILHLKT